MRQTLVVCAALSLSVINCTQVEQMKPPGSGGAGGSDGSGGMGGESGAPRPDSGQGGQPHLELCGITVRCHDGILEGMYGNSCAGFTGVCPLGCRVPSAGTGDLRLDPMEFAQTLCISPADAGDAGDALSDAEAANGGADRAGAGG